jgi:UV DNA damage endonuclease
MGMSNYRLGLCCLHLGLEAKGHKFQTMTYNRFSQLSRDVAVKTLSERYLNNIQVLRAILLECVKNGWCYRANTDMFPLMTLLAAGLTWDELPNRRLLDRCLDECAKIVVDNNLRISCHPDQFNVLASSNLDAVERTIVELNHHGWVMNRLGAQKNYDSPINIHINGSQGEVDELANRFAVNFARLNDDVRCRLVVENEDKGLWNVSNILRFSEITKIPVTFDYLHHQCNNDGMSEADAFARCATTWQNHRPLFHYCETLPGQDNRRKHADVPTVVPDVYGFDVDLDYEFKHKDKALMRARKPVLDLVQK